MTVGAGAPSEVGRDRLPHPGRRSWILCISVRWADRSAQKSSAASVPGAGFAVPRAVQGEIRARGDDGGGDPAHDHPVVTFRTELWAGGGHNVGIVVPPEIVESFGRGKRVPVTVTVDGEYSYRSSIVSMGGQFLISFNAHTRSQTGRGAGDEVEVTLEVDDAPRTVEMPAVLVEAVRAEPELAGTWERLSYSKQRAHAEAVTSAKTEATRDRRVAAVLTALRAAT